MPDLSRVLTLGALLVGALSLFAPAPAEAQSNPMLAAVTSGTNAPTATTLSFTVTCVSGGGSSNTF